MKKTIILFLFILLGLKTIAFDFSQFAPTGQVLYYKINNQTTTVTVTAPAQSSSRTSYIGYRMPAGDLIIPSVVAHNGVNYVVTAIDKGAFSNCLDLKSVILSDSIRIIGDESFANCKNLKRIKLSNNLIKIGTSAFLSCEKLQQVIFPENLREISKHAFSNCVSLEEISLPDNIINIEAYTFYSCKNLEKIKLPQSLEYIGESAFAFCSDLDSISFPNTLQIIDNKAFSSCANIQNLQLPQSLINMGIAVFSSCVNLKSVELPESLREISNSAFMYCKNLETINLPNTIQLIDNNAFEYCSKLKKIQLPASITSIGHSTFANCTSLDSIQILDNIKIIGKYSFQNCKALKAIDLNAVETIEKYAFENCANLEKVNLSRVKEIREYAFSKCTKLETIEIPNTIDTIRNYVFYTCTNLKTLKLADNIKMIGNYAFYKCVNLDSVNLPSSLTKIGLGAFERCSSMTSISFGENVETIYDYAFNNCTNLRNITFKSTKAPRVFNNTWNKLPKDIIISLPQANDSLYLVSLLLENNIKQIKEEKQPIKLESTRIENIAYTKINAIDITIEDLSKHNTHLVGISIPAKEVVVNTMQTVVEKPAEIIKETKLKRDILLKAFSDNTAMGIVEGEGKYMRGSKTNIVAKAKDGYKFVAWNDNNVENPRIVELTDDTLFYAIFEPETYIIDVNTNDIMMGDAYGSGIYDYNSDIIITADAFEGYRFVQWNDGKTENPRTIKVNEKEKIYIAIFAPKNGVELNEKLTCYPNPTKGEVYLSQKAKIVEVLNASGVVVAVFNDKSVVDISSLPSGTYTFRVTINEGIQTLKVILE